MSHIVSLHFKNPFKNSDLDTKLDAIEDLDIPLSEGDHVEVVGIWRNEDGSVGIHVEVIEEPEMSESARPEIQQKAENTQEPQELQEPQDKQKIPRDDITTSNGDDNVLDLPSDMKDAEEKIDEDFEEAAEETVYREKKSKEAIPKPGVNPSPKEEP